MNENVHIHSAVREEPQRERKKKKSKLFHYASSFSRDLFLGFVRLP